MGACAGIRLQTAYRWFREGTLPVPVVWVNQRTVLVSPDAPAGPRCLVVWVSSCDQKADLDQQVDRLTSWAAGAGGLGEMERAARQFGVTSTTLRQHGWKTASPERVKAAGGNPPDWLVTARERRHAKRARQRGRCDRASTAARLGVQPRAVRDRDIRPGEVGDLLAARLGVQPRAVRERGIGPGEVGDLLAARPGWLIAEQERRQAQTEREAEGRLRRELAEALVTSVHEVWFQELKHAVTGADADAVDARWAPEVRRARREARRLAGDMTAEQVRARIGRDQDASYAAARYRASQLLRRALEG